MQPQTGGPSRSSANPEGEPARCNVVENGAEVRRRMLVLRRALCLLDECLSDVAGAGTQGPQVYVQSLVEAGEPQLRRCVGGAIDQYERAVSRFRSAVVRTLVDDAGLTLAAAARCLGVSRTMAARLYRILEPDEATGSAASPEA